MSSPNPLIPQGSLQAKGAGGASNVRIAVATIIAIHVVFFGGLLLQGCKREPGAGTAMTNAPVETNASLSLPPMDTSGGGLYYTNPANLPQDTGSVSAGTASTQTGYSTANAPLFDQVPATGTGAVTGTVPPTTQDGWPTTADTSALPGTIPQADLGTKEYTVMRGDSFYKIAKANGLTTADIQNANPGVDPARIQPGMKIKVPLKAAQPAGATTASAGSTGAAGNTYKVKSGDNLSKIARQYGVTVTELRSANNLRTAQIRVGQTLKIPAKRERTTATAPAIPAGQNPATNLTF